jgi:DNA-binding transcriptional LysR family regulator
MSAPASEGEVRLGVPHDIVGPYLPPILNRFDRAWPRVRVSLKCTTTPRLLELLRKGAIDLTLTTEQRCGSGGETLLEDDLVWAGARNGAAHERDPLPVSLGDEKCAFRAVVLAALRAAGRDWRPVCEVSSMELLLASIEATWRLPRFCTTIPRYLQSSRDRRCRDCRIPDQYVLAARPPKRNRRRARPQYPAGIGPARIASATERRPPVGGANSRARAPAHAWVDNRISGANLIAPARASTRPGGLPSARPIIAFLPSD